MDALPKCQKKKRYHTRPAASLAKRQMKKRHGWVNHIYSCGSCGGYHLSPLTQTEAERIKAEAAQIKAKRKEENERATRN